MTENVPAGHAVHALVLELNENPVVQDVEVPVVGEQEAELLSQAVH